MLRSHSEVVKIIRAFKSIALAVTLMGTSLYWCTAMAEDHIEFLIDSGSFEQAYTEAVQVQILNPESARLLYQQSLALYLLNRKEEAGNLAMAALRNDNLTFEGGMGGALLGIFVRVGFDQLNHQSIVSFIISRYPALANLDGIDAANSFAEVIAPPHPIQYLAMAHDKLGNVELAMKLRDHIGFADEDYFRTQSGDGSLLPHHAWMLASLGGANLTAETAVAYLRAAIDAGFIEGWRFNYQVHATLIYIHNHPEYADILSLLESGV